jgi:pimeloyl-ACP methyl ester carboxylesterase
VAWLSGGYITFALAAWFVTRFHRTAAAARMIRHTARAVLLIVVAAIIMELCATAVVVFAATAPAPRRQAEWSDASPHKAILVTVEEDVRLEVLDWGGSGQALVLLAGLGDTAHVFDDVAPMLAMRYRVVGVTRRGHRGSSAASGGYGFARLAEDVIRVVDAMGIDNPVAIGHSFAGEELHVLGARYATKVRGLVYVDGAFDRGDDADSQRFNTAARTVPAAPSPTAGDLMSFTALRAYLQKHGGRGPEWSLPEGHLRTRYRANADGTVGGLWAPDSPVRQAMASAIQAAYKPYRPERIRVPALAIYAVPKSAEDLIRRGSSDRLAFPELVTRAAGDAALRESVEELYLLTRERVRNHERWFEAFADRARVVELSGTHHLIISNPREVLAQIDAFVSSLPPTR